MEMDIPDPDELEWLEATSHLYEDFEPPIEEEEEEQQPYFEEEEEQVLPQIEPESQIPTKQTLLIPAKHAPIALNINGKKRFRSDAGGVPEAAADEVSDDKRSRIESEEVEVEEDWLRYSPPPPPPPEEVEVVEEKIISRFASEIDGDCIPITGLDGERVYAKMNIVETEDRFSKLDIRYNDKGLIPESITALMEKVEHDALEKALQDSIQSQSDVILPDVLVVNEQLWVDKYAPNSFMELLSDEQTNREVLMWLKQWDSCVFGTEIKSTTEDVLSSLRRYTSVVQHHKVSTKSSYSGKHRESRFGNYNTKVQETGNFNQGDNDSKNIQDLWNKKRKVSGPPEQKILLLCGPPGLGKTTLAHVAARHCGYRVMEINASDDRSSSTIESKILDVVQMNSVIGDSKPKCLIIDEIDGALKDGKGAVEVILKMVSADKKSSTSEKENSGHEEHSGKAASKKKRKDTSLLRPVICICNDLYAPALRQLRQVAKVHIFVQPTVSRIVTRLKFICNKEGLKTSSIALTALAEYTDCDIRSCLNTLQFLNKKKESLSVLDISSQVVGRKDTSKTLFDVWKEIFQKKKPKRDRKPVSRGSVMLNEFEHLHSLISNRGDYDLIMDGIHENMLQLNYHDPMMRKTTTCSHSLGDSDIFHNYIMRTQKMSLLAYQPGFAIGIHGIISQHERPNIEWPKSFQRYRTTLIEKVDTLHSWQNKITPYISRHISIKSFVEDTISPLLHILSPSTLRPVSSHILSDKEKKDMEQLVYTMVSYSITYKNIKSDLLPVTSFTRHETFADVSILGFDPPLGDYINFKDYISCHFVLASAVKQVLVHEVEKQKIRQNSINRSMQPSDDVSNKENNVLASKVQPSTAERTSESATNKKIPFSFLKPQTNPQTTSSSKSSVVAVKPKASESTKKKPSSKPINFFERFKKVTINGSQCEEVVEVTATMERDLRPLLFKFNEGFTNAVKRPVRMREFLL